jgi:hypothetical protein
MGKNQDNYREEEAYDQEYRNNRVGVKGNLAYDFEESLLKLNASTPKPLNLCIKNKGGSIKY